MKICRLFQDINHSLDQNFPFLEAEAEAKAEAPPDVHDSHLNADENTSTSNKEIAFPGQ